MANLNLGETGDQNESIPVRPEANEDEKERTAQSGHDEDSLRYRIDRDYLMVSVAGNWNAFAVENEGHELAGDSVIGRRLWEFITDPATREIYRQLVDQAFDGRSVQFDVRCDAPDTRRCAQVSIYPSDDGTVEFEIHTTKVEPRPPQELLRRGNSSTTGLIMSCSWCNKIRTARDQWDEIEDAIEKLHFFELDCMPGITHATCPDCSRQMNAICD